MINGNEYAWEDIEFVADNNPIPMTGITAIEYTSKKMHANVYGRGAKPVSMARGKEEYDAKITVLQSELEAWQKTHLKGESLTTKKAFTGTVAYAPVGGVSTVDQILYCRILEVKKGITNEDGHMVCELPLAVGLIKYNV